MSKSNCTMNHPQESQATDFIPGDRVCIISRDGYWYGKKGVVAFVKDDGESVYVNVDGDYDLPLCFAPAEITGSAERKARTVSR